LQRTTKRCACAYESWRIKRNCSQRGAAVRGEDFREIFDLLSTEIELALRELPRYDRSRFAAERAEYLEAQCVDLSALDEPPAAA